MGDCPRTRRSHMMKTLLAAAALAAVVASPALAQTTATQRQFRGPNADAYVYSNGYRDVQRRSANPSNDVYDISGRYIGSDPDPTVRDQLARDPTGSD